MVCKAFEENLVLYVYDEMPDSERGAVDEHLAGCEHCRLALDEARRMRALLSECRVLEPAPELLVHCRQRLELALDREQLGWRGLVKAWLPSFISPQTSGAVAALTLVVFGFSLGWMVRPRAARVLPNTEIGGNIASMPVTTSDLGGARINSITQVAPDPQTGEVRITLNAERRVNLEGSLDDPRIQQVLLYAVKSNANPGIRLDTLDALRTGTNSPSVQIALLYALGHDPNAGVRMEALKAVRNMDWSRDVQTALVDASERDANLGVRDEAIDQIVEHAVNVKDQDEERDLIPMLKRLAARDSDGYVRMKSLTALHRLGETPEGIDSR